MKELTIEEKAKAYDEAYKIAKNVHTFSSDIAEIKRMEEIFPKLKESEDERIRESLLKYLHTLPNHYSHSGVCAPEWISWIEKQGEQKPAKNIVETWKDMRLEVYQQASGNRHEPNYSDDTTKMFSLNDIDEIIEKISEQKSVDKVELKFKVGDWVVQEDVGTYKVVEVCESWYEVIDSQNNHYSIGFDKEYMCHLWTIQDAKDGDVLACESGWTCIFKTLVNDETFSSYCFMDNTKWFCETGSECHTLKEEFVKAYNGKIHPATKEQRDFLFQKMKEAGYEWDADKKKLEKDEIKIKAGRNYRCTKTHIYAGLDWLEDTKYYADDDYSLVNNGCTCFCPKYSKYEHNNLFEEVECDDCIENQCEQKPAWSEVDENAFDSILNDLRQGVMPDDEDMNWLKSLKDRYTWKPSNEQMNNLEYISTHPSHIDDQNIKIIRSLYNDLKKLM